MLGWRDTYSLGIEQVDLQHRYFLDLINRIDRRLRDRTGVVEREPLLAELEAYARFHFISEENLMAEYGFPGLTGHRVLHSDLLGHLNNEEKLYELGMAGPDHLLDWLHDWFVTHTQGADREFAAYCAATRGH